MIYERIAQARKSVPAAALEAFSLIPDLLTPLACERRETSHTRALSYFLGAQTAAGDVSLFPLARECAAALLSDAGVKVPRVDPSDVRAEFQLDKGRADVYFCIGDLHVLIEAKVDAEEGADQRKRYCDWLAKYHPGRGLLVFLTCDENQHGDAPRRFSAFESPESIGYHEMSFSRLLELWLPIAAARQEDDGTRADARDYLKRYLKTVAMHLCSPVCAQPGTFDQWQPGTQLALMNRIRAAWKDA
ncbi:MAG: PD-(D/E)XK nuclease family protein [Planctomycetes bacterium]|nr:PD-(D/E)XK nuclease family protein [Planctomycetota bacterium]